MTTALGNLRDSRWDYRAMVWTALLVPVPIASFYVARYWGLTVSASEDVVTLLVMLPLGGPHVAATFMRTLCDGDFRTRERTHHWLSWALFAVVVLTALSSVFWGVRLFGYVPMQLLLTGFFFWASFHVLQQMEFCASSFATKARDHVKWGRALELAVLFGSLYPFSFFRMSMIDPGGDTARANPNALASSLVMAATGDSAFVDDYVFRIGRTTPLLPSFMTWDLIWVGVMVAYLTIAGAYALRSLRQWREGTLEWRRFQLVALTGGIGFFLPLVPNLDSAFQGINAWHCAQYLRLSWLLHQEERTRNVKGNSLVRWYSAIPTTRRYYWSLFALTLCTTSVMFGVALLIQNASGAHWRMFGMDPSELARDPKTGLLEYRPGALLISYYLLGFGLLLMHYFQDSWFFARRRSLNVKIPETTAGRTFSSANVYIQ